MISRVITRRWAKPVDEVLVPFVAVFRRHWDHQGFVSFVFGCAFDFAFSYFPHWRSAESGLAFWRCNSLLISHRFPESREYTLVEAGVLPHKQNTRGVLGKDKIFHIRATTCSVAWRDWSSVADAVAHMRSSHFPSLEVLELVPALLVLFDAYDVALDEEGEWDLSNIPPTNVINIRSSLREEFSATRNKCVEYSVQAPMKAAAFSEMALRGLNNLGKPLELSGGVTQWDRAIQSSKDQKPSLWRWILLHFPKL